MPFKIVYLLLKGIYHILLGIGHGISWLVLKIRDRLNKSAEVKETRKNSNETKSPSKFSIFKSEKDNPKYSQFQELKQITGSFDTFESNILTSGSLIGIILGARGTGKSAIGMKLLENIKAKTSRSVCAMGFKKETLPSWILSIDSIENIPNNSVVLLDEAGIEFSSRESMSSLNKILSNLLLISRHKDLTILFISQNSSNLDLNILRQADFLIMKPSSLMQKDFERKKIKEIYEKVNQHFKELSHEEGLTYVYSNKYQGFISNPLPSFWNSNVSKAYSNFKEEQ